ncbi:MAG: hypothetical protein WA687_01900, partial [Solirubrobacterales bacterium]
MRRLAAALAIALIATLVLLPVSAQAASPAKGNFGLYGFDITYTDKDGLPQTQAGSHPFALTLTVGANMDSKDIPEGRIRDLVIEQIPGLLGDTTAYQTCSSLEFLQGESEPACPLETAVGITANSVTTAGNWLTSPLYTIAPPPGVLLRLGFSVEVARIVVDVALSPEYPHSGISPTHNISQILNFFANRTQLWGDPAADAHDELRGPCGANLNAGKLPPEDLDFNLDGFGKFCSVEPNSKPFLTLPTYCGEPLVSFYEALSWEGDFDAGQTETHDAKGNPQPFEGCGKLGFKPAIAARPTTRAAQSPTGLDLSIEVADEGLTSVSGLSQSRIRDAVFYLPEGMTANPSVAEGLEVCTEEDLERETLQAEPGEGCPEASKLGTLEVESPLVEEPLNGSLFIAEPYKNEFGTLIAFYIVVKNPKLGVIVKQATRVEPDPKTGQLIGIAEDIPPTAAFSRLNLHFREGGRSPLISPSLCGSYETEAELFPWSESDPVLATSTFKVISGPNEGPCPKGGTPPFEPGFEAGSTNNAAGAHSPFTMRLTRRDGDQDLTRFDATLPPGVGGILAGISKCSDTQIARAKAKTGKEELANPSCPAGSKIGRAIGGAGVGSQLTYVPGSLYLAGPFGGAPLSVVGIVPAVAGPFDVGTVVVRQALKIDPRTAEITADGAKSDPIPHILAGIPLSVREIQVYADRPKFTYNPTSCDPFATNASIWGGGANAFSLSDDSPAKRQARYQAADCSRLGFKPSLSLKLKGGTKRGDHPKLRSVYKPRPGDANLEDLVLRFPRSAFLDQGHIRTICTRVQFAAKACPERAIYGHARVFTPVLDEPLEGPLYLRSSNHNLPDVVLALHGIVDVEAVARVDSKQGGLRVSFTDVPDAPVTKAVVTMQGGKKGLIVNSTDLCIAKRRANVRLDAHSGKRITIKPVVKA